MTSPDAALDKADRLLTAISAIAEPNAFDQLARQLLEERKVLLDKHRAFPPAEGEAPGPFGWTHGDLQYRNILRHEGKVTAVLDWDRVAVKPLAEEVVRTGECLINGGSDDQGASF